MKQNNNTMPNDSNVGLAYKDHREFFSKFYNARDQFLLGLADLSFNEEESKYKYNFRQLKYLINNVTTYLYKHNYIDYSKRDDLIEILDKFTEKFSEKIFNELIEYFDKELDLSNEHIIPIHNKISSLKTKEYSLEKIEEIKVMIKDTIKDFVNAKDYIYDSYEYLIELIKEKKYKKYVLEVEELNEFINLTLSKEEILPLYQEDNNEMDKFWQEEPNKAFRESKKAFTDMMKNMINK